MCAASAQRSAPNGSVSVKVADATALLLEPVLNARAFKGSSQRAVSCRMERNHRLLLDPGR